MIENNFKNKSREITPKNVNVKTREQNHVE